MAEPTSAQEVAEFEAWLARDPLHATSYSEMDAVMAATSVRRGTATPQRAGPTILRPALAFGLAAIAIITTAVLWQSASAPAFATFVNNGSAIRSVQLEDGTRVWLDVGARIDVRLTDERREIEVRAGRVRVVPAAGERPLEILADAARTEPGSTRTDVTVDAQRVTFGAVDGPLAIADPSRGGDRASLRLETGEALALGAQGSRPARLEHAWTASRLRFSEAPLRAIVTLANRLGDPDVVAGDADVAGLQVSGVFDLRDTRRLGKRRRCHDAINLGLVPRARLDS